MEFSELQSVTDELHRGLMTEDMAAYDDLVIHARNVAKKCRAQYGTGHAVGPFSALQLCREAAEVIERLFVS